MQKRRLFIRQSHSNSIGEFWRLTPLFCFDKIEFVEISTDYYWIITSDKWDDFTSDITNPVVGSLVDDWQCLQKILNNEERMVSYVDYDRFATILRAISEKMAPSKK